MNSRYGRIVIHMYMHVGMTIKSRCYISLVPRRLDALQGDRAVGTRLMLYTTKLARITQTVLYLRPSDKVPNTQRKTRMH